MIKPEMVPDEAVDALLDSSNVAKPWHHAIAAALNAWPGMTIAKWQAYGMPDRLVLPLMEKQDDKA